MGFSLVLATLLCLSTWMTMTDANTERAVSCCKLNSNTKVPLERIQNYTMQPSICPGAAIIFKTTKGKRICADPTDSWAIRAKKKVDRDRADMVPLEKPQAEEGSTINITAAACTEPKKKPQRRNRNGRRRQGRKGRGKKGQRAVA